MDSLASTTALSGLGWILSSRVYNRGLDSSAEPQSIIPGHQLPQPLFTLFLALLQNRGQEGPQADPSADPQKSQSEGQNNLESSREGK